jgi:hypothetical protein
MDPQIVRLTASLVDVGPAAPAALKEAEVAFGISLPDEYSEFVTERDGAEVFVGPAYLALWKVGDLVELNGLANIDEFAPDSC